MGYFIKLFKRDILSRHEHELAMNDNSMPTLTGDPGKDLQRSSAPPLGERVGAPVRAKGRRSERGATFAEYVLLATLVALTAILGVRAFGNRVSSQFSAINESLDEVM